MRINKIIFLLVFVSCFFSALTGASYGAYKEATISDFLIVANNEEIKISFKVNDCFTSEIEEAILNGIPTTFIFKVNVKKERKKWADLLIQEHTFKHTVKYDILNKVFSVKLSEKGNEIQTVDFNEAKQILSSIKDFKTIPASKLKKNNIYMIEMKAELEKFKLPLYLDYLFFFVNMFNLETAWYRYTFEF